MSLSYLFQCVKYAEWAIRFRKADITLSIGTLYNIRVAQIGVKRVFRLKARHPKNRDCLPWQRLDGLQHVCEARPFEPQQVRSKP